MEDKSMAAVRERLEKAARNEVRVHYKRAGEKVKTAGSKIGGSPDLPPDIPYPAYMSESREERKIRLPFFPRTEKKSAVTERPLAFLAQIDLKDTAGYDTEGLLPKEGVLSFFYEPSLREWGYRPNKDTVRVLYFPDGGALAPRGLPEGVKTVAPELEISFEKHISLPSEEDFEYGDEELESEDYEDICLSLGYDCDNYGSRTKLLGYPDVIQDPMETECEVLSRRGSDGERAEFSEAEIADIREKAAEWILLFQMGTVETEGIRLMFGDCGHIYFWIRRADLQRRDFGNVCMIMQCS